MRSIWRRVSFKCTVAPLSSTLAVPEMKSTVLSGRPSFMPRENDEPYSAASLRVGVCITSTSAFSGFNSA